MKGDNQMTNIEALTNLYVALGGNAADISSTDDNPDIISAIAGLEIKAAVKKLYFDGTGQNGIGEVADPFILFTDEDLTTHAQAPEDPEEWVDYLLIAPNIAYVLMARPSVATLDQDGVLAQLECTRANAQEEPIVYCFGFYTGGGGSDK